MTIVTRQGDRVSTTVCLKHEWIDLSTIYSVGAAQIVIQNQTDGVVRVAVDDHHEPTHDSPHHLLAPIHTVEIDKYDPKVWAYGDGMITLSWRVYSNRSPWYGNE